MLLFRRISLSSEIIIGKCVVCVNDFCVIRLIKERGILFSKTHIRAKN